MMIAKAVVLAAAVAAPLAVHPPIARSGDKIDLQYSYVGRFTPGEVLNVSARMGIVATSAGAAKITINYQGRSKDIDAALRPDGTIDGTGSDLLAQYNAIPLTLDRGAAQRDGASWPASVPVKVSPTEWQSIPVRVAVSAKNDRTALTVTGDKSIVVFTRGMTVAERVTVSGRTDYRNGALARAHFEVREVVHALKDIPISYEWTMSPSP
ncbi:MAG TPA: hypothetical protein VK669_04505 [Candidatus Limnocylindrales bacterium]|nr:hypothetical protein [Candidatus Limnocylindrales bacterium]